MLLVALGHYCFLYCCCSFYRCHSLSQLGAHGGGTAPRARTTPVPEFYILKKIYHYATPSIYSSYFSIILSPTASPLQYAPVVVPSATYGAVCSPAIHSF